MILTAVDLYDQARSALAEHRTDEAESLLRRALSEAGAHEVELRLRIEISMSWVVFEDAGLDAALRALQQTRGRARRAERADLVATAAVQTAILHARAGDLQAAWRALRRIDADALPEPDRMRMLMNRGTMASELSRFDDAVADLGAAGALADRLDMPPISFMARHNLGWVQFLRGDLPAALQAMHDADDLDVDLDRTVARLDRARVLLEAGLVVDARDLLLQIRHASLGAQQLAELDLDLARCALLLGLRDEAWTRARGAARDFARRREPAWQRRAELVALLARPHVARARALWRRAQDAGDGMVAPHAAAVALTLTGRGTEPAPEIVTSTRSLARSATPSRRIAGLVALARHASRTDLAAARRHLRRAHLTLLQAQLGRASLDLRSAAALHGEEAAELDLDLASVAAPRLQVDAMIAATERWRASTSPTPRLRPDTDPRVATTASELRRLRAEYQPGLPGEPETVRAIDVAERELRTLTWGARTEIPPTAQTLAPARLRGVVDERGVTLVVALRRADRIVAAVLGEGRPRLVDIGDIEATGLLVEAVHADLAARATLGPAHPLLPVVQASLRARLEQLDEAVVAPLGGTGRPLVVVPTRVLSGVPWLSLPSLRGRAVTVAPTASCWVSAHTVVARPRVSVLTGPDLPCAADEAMAVAQQWTLSSSTGLIEALENDDLVHVAAHGQHRSDNPLFSSLRLADGPLVAHELEGIGVRASHVVLSACEVGRATHRPGDQPLGLTATLLASGVGCVVAPVAPVNDEVAARVMGGYHSYLREGRPAADALAAATMDDVTAGAFVCFGAPWQATA